MASLERGRIPSPRPIAVREIPLVNRVEEMKLLKEAVDRAVQGEGGLVFLYGEAGIGKTRLARELRAYANLCGMQVLYGRCPGLFRMDGVPPYVLWSEVIRDYLENSSPEQLYRVIGFYPAEVAKLVPEISQKLRAIPQSFPISPEQEQNRLFEAVSQFIANISREAPLLVILDDLQWTDPSSLLLLHYLARGVYRTPLLLLGAYRSTDIDSKHPLTPVLTELNRERIPQSVSLKRMSLDDVTEMIKQILEQDVPTEFCKLVYEKTRGNPFFAEEVIKSLKEEELIYRQENRWKIKEVSRIEFPETVKSVIKARIGRLDDECQNALTFASFIGNDFTCEALWAVTGIEESKVLDLIERLLQTGLVRHRVVRGEDVCSFTDIVVRDIVYEEVSPFRRKKLHNVVGCALEKAYSRKIDEHYGELALHFLESGDKDKALDYFLKAGEKAMKVYANSETTSYYQSALRLLEEKEGELSSKAHVLESLGDVKGFVGDFEVATKYWNGALSFYDQLGEKEKIARLYRKMWMILYEKGELGKLKDFVDKALKTLEAQPESSETSIAYGYVSGMLWLSGNFAEALSWAEKARQLAEKLNNSEAIAWSYFFVGTVSRTLGDSEKGIEFLEKALKVALENGHVEVALGTYNNLGWALPAEKNERSLEIYEKGAELARKVGHVPILSWFSAALARMHIDMGNIDKAILLAEESVALDRKTGNLIHLPMPLGVLGAIYRILGEWDKSEQYLREKFDLSQKLGDIQSVAGGYESLGWLHFDKG
nr:AAA family ATPase [Candidatus Njordarchaeum guaymaensis]